LSKYEIIFAPEANDHLVQLTASQRAIIIDQIEKQLLYEPSRETKKRKKLRPNPISPWELRIGNLRVFYDVTEKPEKGVSILAIGIKTKNKLTIGKELIIL